MVLYTPCYQSNVIMNILQYYLFAVHLISISLCTQYFYILIGALDFFGCGVDKSKMFNFYTNANFSHESPNNKSDC